MATMKAAKRTEVGTNKVKQLRKAGNIPGIIYGHGIDPQAVTISEHEVELAMQHGDRLLELDVDGEIENVLIKALQYDTFGQIILHVDFNRVDLDERVEVTATITLTGTPQGVKDGGVLQQSVSSIHIECPVQNIPEEIKIMVTEMKMDDRMNLGDIELPEGITLLDDAEALLCNVHELAEEEEATTEEGEDADAPEVIGERNVESDTEE
ncbi:MAG: 50S ribosomal protein L25 [Phycisphaerae bacterium]|nr:50S ribosomal protein L25 [Phycisphaerae bacterium]